MGLIQKLFSSKKVSLRELKVSLLKVERERKRQETSLRKLESRIDEIFEKTKKARRQGKKVEVDFLWEELRLAKTEIALEYRQARVLNLEAITLKRTVWGLERMEAAKNREGAGHLVGRLRASGLDDKLQAQEIREDEYLRELDDILHSLALPESAESESDDPDKAVFLAEIDAINAAEDVGDVDVAQEREMGLKGRLASEEDGS